MSEGAAPQVELVTLTIDGKQVSVPKGTNLIHAAAQAGVEIPHYCYHPHLSVAGNCRMCQVQVKGQPKMAIGCNTMATEGMEVATQLSSPEVKDAQAAVLEFILINHPLDCTVCDQAGQCKLQDYHFEYNARPSRFLEEKEHKIKAMPLGDTVMLDGERCIMCTRCIRFCDEVTKTSELGMLNRGDRSVIAVDPEHPLENPLSGTVVDLCPVGALTHRPWRFNTRIWFTDQVDSLCTGCSTGCNAKVATRDGEVVQVKARLNSEVNKEWMCDEGRYGFHRFLPAKRFISSIVEGENAKSLFAKMQNRPTVVFLSPDLTLEDYFALTTVLKKAITAPTFVIAYKERSLSEVEKILVSPDYAANFRGAEWIIGTRGEGKEGSSLQARYEEALATVRGKRTEQVLIFGDRGVFREDQDETFLAGVRNAHFSLATLTDAELPLHEVLQGALPSRSILERSGLLMNRKGRVQYLEKMLQFPDATHPEWRWAMMLGESLGKPLSIAAGDKPFALWNDREMTRAFLQQEERLKGATIPQIKKGGIPVWNI